MVNVIDDIDPNDVVPNPKRTNATPKTHSSFEPEYRKRNIEPINYHATIDGAVVESDENTINNDNSFIDNNDYVVLPGTLLRDFVPSMPSKQPPVNVLSKEPQASKFSPKIGEYILMANGKIILTGELSVIESKVSAILFGEDKEITNTTVDDLVVLKRVNIKFGVFVE